VKTVADTFEVSRSNLIERLNAVRARAASYGKQDDEWLLPMIRELVDAHPTYGYRRITALLNRRFRTNGEPLVNHKRVYRIMASSHLLLQKYTGKRINRVHDVIVRTLRSNTRWCSDGFEIHAWNGEIVRVAFALECDREIMAWSASTAGVTGEMVRDMMLIAVESRFGSYCAANRVEWLSDNGSCYTATETIAFAYQIGLTPCFTPVRSPRTQRHVGVIRKNV